MSYDVFISYASKDKTAADAVCARLEAAGIRCWIAPRDITPGTSYGEAIIEAIHGLKVMVLVFSSHANLSAHIPKEVERAVSSGVAIIPFRIEDVAPGKSLDYFIGSVHWLDAMTPPLEQHLDSLAKTVRKLLPAKSGAHGTLSPQTSGVWQQSAPPASPLPAASVPAARPIPASGPASSSKSIWIGVAAVAVIAVIVLGVIMMRGGGNIQSTANIPAAGPPVTPASPPANTTAPPGKSTSSNGSNPIANAVVDNAAPVVKSAADAIVGCYQWFNNAPVVIHENGTMVGGPFTARWRVVNAAQHSYTFTWPEAVDTVTLSPDQQSLKGGNQYGYPTSGARLAGSTGLMGSWTWPNGAMVIVSGDGTFNVFGSTLGGKWKTVNASQRIYTLTWPDPVDSVTLSADGSRVSGSNQYGIAISGVKTQPCSEN